MKQVFLSYHDIHTDCIKLAKLIKKCEASFSGALIRKKAKAYLAILEERELALYLLILTSAVLSLVLLNALE